MQSSSFNSLRRAIVPVGKLILCALLQSEFLDRVSLAQTTIGGVVYVGNYGGAESGAGSTVVPFSRLTDDINEGGVSGAIIVVDPNTGQLTTLTDFPDLHTFNIAFDQSSEEQFNPYAGAVDALNVVWYGEDESESVEDSISDWQAAEAMRISDWYFTGIERARPRPDPSRWTEDSNPGLRSATNKSRQRHNGIGILYGLRAIEREDFLKFYGTGGILGTVKSDTIADNHVMGPAIGLVWIKSYGPWTARMKGLVSVGFNSGEIDQDNSIGQEFVPGALNRPRFAQPSTSSNRYSHDELSPNGELRAEANLRITEHVTFAINWSGIAVDNALQAEDRVRYYLPDMGIVDPGNQRLLVHHFFCGIEMVR